MTVTIEIPYNIELIVNQRSRDEHIDKLAVLIQMLREGAEYYLIDQYSRGRISKGKLAELLDMDLYEVNDLLEKYHIKSSISYDRFIRGVEIAETKIAMEE